jgi:hypothetical protein
MALPKPMPCPVVIAPHLRLDTNATLTGAIAMYRRLGWSSVAGYNDDPYAQVWFEKHL